MSMNKQADGSGVARNDFCNVRHLKVVMLREERFVLIRESNRLYKSLVIEPPASAVVRISRARTARRYIYSISVAVCYTPVVCSG
jgi:hypothetical protein